MSSNPKTKHQAGTGVLGALMAALILMIIGLNLSGSITETNRSHKQLAASAECQEIATNILESISSMDNSARIRNFLPNPSLDRALSSPEDPLCNEERPYGCDALPHFSDWSQTFRMPGPDQSLYTAQNIRGGVSWALAIYNRRKPFICSDFGELFRLKEGTDNRPAELRRLNQILPVPLPQIRNLKSIRLFVNPGGLSPIHPSCSTRAPYTLNPHSREQLAVRVQVTVEGNANQGDRSCSNGLTLNYGSDNRNLPLDSSLTRTFARNGDPLISAPRAPGVDAVCTCQRGPSGCTTEDVHGLQISSVASEPGSNFLCRVEENGMSTPVADSYFLCAARFRTTLEGPLSNSPTQTRITASFAHSPLEKIYQIHLRTLDTSGNLSENEVSTIKVVTRTPSCPPSGPPVCPPGTSTPDSCGAPNACPPNLIPSGTGCPPTGTYFPGEEPGDSCGRRCPPGTRPRPPRPACPPGYEPDESGECCGPLPHYRVVAGICYPSCGALATSRGFERYDPGYSCGGDYSGFEHTLTPRGWDCSTFAANCGVPALHDLGPSYETVRGTGGQCCHR